MGIEDELDELLDPEGALEAKFDALAKQIERGQAGAGAGSDDPLRALKERLDNDQEAGHRTGYVVLLCPRCGAKNRADRERLRGELPRCGRCQAELIW